MEGDDGDDSDEGGRGECQLLVIRECKTNCGTPKYMAPEVFAVGKGKGEQEMRKGREREQGERW